MTEYFYGKNKNRCYEKLKKVNGNNHKSYDNDSYDNDSYDNNSYDYESCDCNKKVHKSEQKSCKCDIYRCGSSDPYHGLCPEPATLLKDLNNAINGGNLPGVGVLLTDSAVLNIYSAGFQTVVGRAQILAALAQIFALTTTFRRDVTEIVPQDCDKFIEFGLFVVTKRCPLGPLPIPPVNGVVRVTVACERGALKISHLEIWADLAILITTPCPVAV